MYKKCVRTFKHSDLFEFSHKMCFESCKHLKHISLDTGKLIYLFPSLFHPFDFPIEVIGDIYFPLS